MRTEHTPHKLHLFFCTNTRKNGEKSCGDTEDTEILAEKLKKRFKEDKLPVRITRTACLGPCGQGPNIMCYPQEVWFQKVDKDDIDEIDEAVRKILDSGSPRRDDDDD